ncbi:MAG: hypothetical protein PHX24_12225, partial [Acidithiobacillus sp.]|nr:hypothetical protein [Acidithiobacillus sp.]
MDDILWVFNARILLIMLGMGVLLYILGWFFYKQNEKIGNTLAIIGGVIIIIAMVVAAICTNYNVPESWLRNLPVAEKKMMRNYIEKKHQPISIFTFRFIQADYYIKAQAKAEKEQQDKDD